jgi:broad specificity phosphatase PhoE
MHVMRAALACGLLALAGGARTAVPPQAASLAATGHVLNELRHGGYVIVMAHGPSAPDEHDVDAAPDDCAAQQSLTDTGRLMASGVGRFLAREHVPVGAVLSSRYCRGVETAERIAQHTHASKLRRLDDLNESARASPPDKARRSATLRRLAGTPPAAGTNTIVVTHRANIADALGPGLASVRDGELFVLRPSGDGHGGRAGSFRLVHRWTVRDLSAYARAGKS